MIIKKIYPIGYCKGVVDAIELAKCVKKEFPKQSVFVFGMIVHNEEVVKELSQLGIQTIDTEKEDPIEILKRFEKDDIVIFTAHGHNEVYNKILEENGVKYFDAVCVKVKQSMDLIQKEVRSNQVIYIGKKGHPETNASISISPNVILYDIHEGIEWNKLTSSNPLIVNQTTLSFLELSSIHQDIKAHLPSARFLSEICDATKLRQQAIVSLKEDVDLLLVIGSKKSSNTSKLFELGKKNPHIKEVQQIGTVNELSNLNLKGKELIYLCSGTSTSPTLISQIENELKGE